MIESNGFHYGHQGLSQSLQVLSSWRWCSLTKGPLHPLERDRLLLWEVGTGKLVLNHARDKGRAVLLSGAIAFSPDAKLLAVGLEKVGQNNELDGIDLWEVMTAQRIARLEGEPGQIRCLTFAPDGKILAVGGQKVLGRSVKNLAFWHLPTGKVVKRLSGHETEVYSIAFSPNASLLASASADTTALVWDAKALLPQKRLESLRLARSRLESLWKDLSSNDAAQAYRAIWTMLAGQPQSLSFLVQQLGTAAAQVDPEQLVKLIDELDDDRFAVRERATQQLSEFGSRAGPALRKALEGKPSAELRQRAETLLSRLQKDAVPPERVRAGRAVAALEYIGTTEAVRALEKLSKGPAGTPETEEARVALQRLLKRNAGDR